MMSKTSAYRYLLIASVTQISEPNTCVYTSKETFHEQIASSIEIRPAALCHVKLLLRQATLRKSEKTVTRYIHVMVTSDVSHSHHSQQLKQQDDVRLLLSVTASRTAILFRRSSYRHVANN